MTGGPTIANLHEFFLCVRNLWNLTPAKEIGLIICQLGADYGIVNNLASIAFRKPVTHAGTQITSTSQYYYLSEEAIREELWWSAAAAVGRTESLTLVAVHLELLSMHTMD